MSLNEHESAHRIRGILICWPVDFTAAAKFDRFFYNLVEAIGNDPVRPSIHDTSPFAMSSH